jgi:phage replication-related protein YjqB (UPF0714/DUF867 family)
MFYRIPDEELREAIERHFDLDAAGWHMSGPAVLEHLEKSGVVMGGTDRAKEMQISTALQRLGVRKIRTASWRGYEGIRPKQAE